MVHVLFTVPFSGLTGGIIPDVPVYAYGFMMMIAFVAGTWMAVRQARRDGIAEDTIYNTAMMAIVTGIIGSRALYIILFADESMTMADWPKIWTGGLVYYGGVLLGTFVCYLYLRRRPEPLGLVVDCFAPGAAAGIGFGRIGCFLNGCCHGVRCPADAWYGVRYPADSAAAYQQAWDGLIPYGDAALAVWPAQLMESACGFLILAVILWRFPKRAYAGQMLVYFFILYAVARFGLEFIRDDTAPYWAIDGVFSGLKAGQIVALVTFIFALGLNRVLVRRAAAHA